MELATAFVAIRPDASSFEAELVAAISGIGEQDISVTAETGVAASDMDAFMADYFNLDVDVDADTSAAVAAVESIPDGEVEVTANTEQAEAALDQVKEKVEETTDSTSKLGEAAQGALTGMGGLSGAAGGAANALGASAVAGGAAAVGLFSFAQAAIDAESAGQRFELIAGSLGPELQTIDVGGLSGDIGDLALQLGSSDEAMLNATASFVTFAESTGASRDEIVRTSENINALALRAVALNPALGDAGAVAERMTNALARGGRATTQFGIGLTSAEINARAMADTGKTNAAELTQFEKAAAGAAIAVERLGGSMGEDFAAGSQNARTEWNRMTESLGEASEQVGSSMLPAIENITEAVTNLSEGLTNLDPGQWLEGLWGLGPGLIANGFTDLWSSISGGEDQIRGVGTLVNDELPAGLRDTASAADAAASEMQDFTEAMSDYLNEVVGLPASQRDVQESITDMVATMQDSEATWFDIADAQDEVTTSTADLIENMRDHGATQAELDGTIDSTIGMLRSERDAGRLTQDQFRTLADEIRGIPHDASTTVTTPGLSGAITNSEKFAQKAKELDKLSPSTPFEAPGLSDAYGKSIDYLRTLEDLDGKVITSTFKTIGSPIGKNARGTESAAPGLSWVGEEGPELIALGGGERIWSHPESMAMAAAGATVTNHYTGQVVAPFGANASEFGQALGSAYGSGIVAGLAGQIGNAVATKASLDAIVESALVGAGVGRASIAGGAPVTVVHQTTLDGRVLTETVNELNYVGAIAEGYET